MHSKEFIEAVTKKRFKTASILFALALLLLHPSIFILYFYFIEDNLIQREKLAVNGIRSTVDLLNDKSFRCDNETRVVGGPEKAIHLHFAFDYWGSAHPPMSDYLKFCGYYHDKYVDLRGMLSLDLWFTRGVRALYELNAEFLHNEKGGLDTSSTKDLRSKFDLICKATKLEGNEEGPTKAEVERTKQWMVSYLSKTKAGIEDGIALHESNLISIHLIGVFFLLVEVGGVIGAFWLIRLFSRRRRQAKLAKLEAQFPNSE